MQEFMKLYGLLLQLNIIYLLYQRLKNKKRRRWWVRPANINRGELGFFNTSFQIIKRLDDEDFFCQTRMSKPVYELLLNLLKDNLIKRSIRPTIDFECRLVLTLSFLSQGVSIKFLAWSFKMGRSTVRKIVLETCEVIWKVLSEIYVSRPNITDYKVISKRFEDRWNMPHCVGAIDGKHIELVAPPNSGSQYFNYKKTHSIVLLAACDADYTFTDVSLGSYGSQSDGGIFTETSFGKDLLSGKLPLPEEKPLPNSDKVLPYYFVGDAAFPLKNNLMRPYPGRNLSQDKSIFNYRLSRARRIIENCFGILVARWRVLRAPLNLLPENAEKIVLATIALYNFIKLNDKSSVYLSSHFVDWEDENYMIYEAEWRQQASLGLRSARMGANNASRIAFNFRDSLKEYFLHEGQYRFNTI